MSIEVKDKLFKEVYARLFIYPGNRTNKIVAVIFMFCFIDFLFLLKGEGI